MRCPFLREEPMKSCQAAPFRKAVARAAAHDALELCSSADHVRCPILPQSREEHVSVDRCPFLRESLAQYCAAASTRAYVPWSASPEQRCAHDGHRFCELFLSVAPQSARRPARVVQDEPEAGIAQIDGVPTPEWLHFSDGHLWLDVGDEGVCHLGLDALVAQLLGKVGGLAFPAVRGFVTPAVVLTVRGVELRFAFPRALTLVAANMRLRSKLDSLTADPYGAGWLLQARLPAAEGERRALLAGLHRGRAACEWMAAEVRRVSERVHEEARLAADGGRFAPELLHHLETEQAVHLLADLLPASEIRRSV